MKRALLEAATSCSRRTYFLKRRGYGYVAVEAVGQAASFLNGRGYERMQ
jgi:hypothetical protein